MADKNSSSKMMYLSIALAVVLMAVVLPFSMSGKGKSDAVNNADDVESRIAPVAKIEMQAAGGDGGRGGRAGGGRAGAGASLDGPAGGRDKSADGGEVTGEPDHIFGRGGRLMVSC